MEKTKKEDNMIEPLKDIAMLRPGKSAQIAAKKISKKYQKQGYKRDKLHEREKWKTNSFQREKKNTEN